MTAGPRGSHHRTSPKQHSQPTSLTLPTLPVSNYALGGHHQILSAQSSSNNHHPHYYHHHNLIQAQTSNPISTRRRESANSSVGSVRRLLAVNRGCRHKIPVHVRAKVIKNFVFLVIGHGLISATLLPLIGLQVRISGGSIKLTDAFQQRPSFAIIHSPVSSSLSPTGVQLHLVRGASLLLESRRDAGCGAGQL